MPSVVAKVKSGAFFFKDAPHWHFSSKKTILLEELVTYETRLPAEVAELVQVDIKNGGDIEVPYGYGSTYGQEFGGIAITGSNKVSIRPVLGDGEVAPLLSSTSYAEMKVWLKRINPVRNVLTFDTGTGEITVDFTHHDNTPNSFGHEDLPAGELRTITLRNQSIYDSDDALVTPAGGESYSYQSGMQSAVTLTVAQAAHASSRPIRIEVSDISILDYVRAGDTMWLKHFIEVAEIGSQSDLPPANDAPHSIAFKITDPDDGNFGAYMIATADGSTYSVFTDLRREGLMTLAFKVVEDPDNAGLYTDGSHVWVEPLDWTNGAFFAAGTENTELVQYFLNIYKGIPESSELVFNEVQVLVDTQAGNVLTASSDSIDTWTTVASSTGADQMAMASGLSTASGLVATLNGVGRDYDPAYRIFVHEMEKSITMPTNYKSHGPVIITDLISTAIDPEGTTNVEFTVDSDRKVILNETHNLIANPTFYLHDSRNGIPGYESFEVDVVKGENGVDCWLHEKAAKLSLNNLSVLRQHIAGIDASQPYTFSFYAKSTGSSLGVKIYGFTGGDHITIPDVTQADQVIEFDSQELTDVWTRYSARVKSLEGIKETPEISLGYTAGGPVGFMDGITDIVIEITKTGGIQTASVDGLQLEQGYNPREFSSHYDLGVVEYETSDEPYAPRFKVSPIDRSDNSGFMVISLEDDDINELGNPAEALIPTKRHDVVRAFRARPWAKLNGVEKFVQTSKFSSTRAQHPGEHFLYPDIAKARFITFLGEPLTTSMKTVQYEIGDDSFHVAVEDEHNNNLSSRVVTVSFGSEELEATSVKDYLTGDLGTAKFTPPPIYLENACPIVNAAVNGTAKFNLGYTLSGATTTTGSLSFSNLPSGHYLKMFNAKGEYAPLQTLTSSSGNNITFSDAGATEHGATITPAQATYALPVPIDPSVPPGYILFTESLMYNTTVENNGNAVISYVSGINNLEIQHRAYQRDNVAKRVTLTQSGAEDNGSTLFNIVDKAFNPARSSVKIKDLDKPTKEFRQTSTDTYTENGFYVDYANKSIRVYDLRTTNIEVSFVMHPFFVNPVDQRKIYVHVNTLMEIIQNLQAGVDNSDLGAQHLESYGSLSAGPISPLSYPLSLRLYFYSETYVTAQHRDLVKTARIIHRHTRPLL